MGDIERRVRDHAKSLWVAAGRPKSGVGAYIGRARELVAIEDSQQTAFTRFHGRPLLRARLPSGKSRDYPP